MKKISIICFFTGLVLFVISFLSLIVYALIKQPAKNEPLPPPLVFPFLVSLLLLFVFLFQLLYSNRKGIYKIVSTAIKTGEIDL